MWRTPTIPAAETGARPLNIVHVITRLLRGGAEENTIATCLHQAANGHRVTLVHGPGADPSWASRFGDRIEFKCVDSLLHPIHPVADLAAIRHLRRLYRRLHADVVHTHESKAGIVGRVAAAFARVPLIVHTIHIAPFVAVSGPKRLLYLQAERACARLSNLLIAVSRGMQRAYLETGIGRGVPIPVIHSGMQLDRFTFAAAPDDWRGRIGGWDGPGKPRFILKIAAFEQRKRQLPLLRALAAGLIEHGDTCLLFAGEGPDRIRCEEEAQRLGLANQVRFLGHDSAPWELVALADVCVHAAEREGLPRTAVQAIAGGKPLVVARLPGIEEIITDGVNGVITSADDLGDLSAELFALLDSPERLAQLQHGARSTDVSSWSEERMGQRIDRAYAAASVWGDSSRRRIAAVEFVGLPGSGKTTIARELIGLLREQRAPVRFSGDIMGDELPFLRRSLRRLALVSQAVVHAGDKMYSASRGLTPQHALGKGAVKTWWNFLSVLAMQARVQRKGMLIADQGLAQGIWTARIRHGRDAIPVQSVSEELDDWIDETLFIHVDAPTPIAQQRLAPRRQRTSLFQEPDCIGDASLWACGEEVVERIQREIGEALESRGLSDRLLRIPSGGSDTPLDRAKTILEHLVKLELEPQLVKERRSYRRPQLATA